MGADGNKDQEPTWERNFIRAMKVMRENARLTQTELARELRAAGMSFHQTTVLRIEAGERPVRLNEALMIADVFGSDLDSMISISPKQDRADLLQAVHDIRSRSGELSYELGRSNEDWLDGEVNAFVSAMDLRINRCLENDNSELDKATRWGIMWTQPLLQAHQTLRHTTRFLNWVGSSAQMSARGNFGAADFSDMSTEEILEVDLNNIMGKIRYWREIYYDSVHESGEFPNDPARLMQAFPYEDD